jgi:hypothetical protein
MVFYNYIWSFNQTYCKIMTGGGMMKYCKNCGSELTDLQTRCPECGDLYVNAQPRSNESYTYNDDGGFLWGLLGFCVPVAGLVLYLVWKDERPNTANAAGIGALVNVVGGIVFYILFIMLAVLLGGM